MLTIESLQRQIQSAAKLESVVRIMKNLAAVNIKHFEKASRSLEHYNRAIELGLQICVRNLPTKEVPRTGARRQVAAIVLGSDQGMCGQFNERIARHVVRTLEERVESPDSVTVMTMGERVAQAVEEDGLPVEKQLAVPGSLGTITWLVQEILLTIDEWHSRTSVQQVLLFYNSRQGTAYQPFRIELLPVDRHWLERLAEREWPNRCIPTVTVQPGRLLSALIREYLFATLFQGVVESLASENASRLNTMQAAEKKVQEHLEELRLQYYQERQRTITSELLDIVSGFEVLTGAVEPN